MFDIVCNNCKFLVDLYPWTSYYLKKTNNWICGPCIYFGYSYLWKAIAKFEMWQMSYSLFYTLLYCITTCNTLHTFNNKYVFVESARYRALCLINGDAIYEALLVCEHLIQILVNLLFAHAPQVHDDATRRTEMKKPHASNTKCRSQFHMYARMSPFFYAISWRKWPSAESLRNFTRLSFSLSFPFLPSTMLPPNALTSTYSCEQ